MKKNRMKKIIALLMASMLLTGCGQTEVTNNEPGNIPQNETVSESGENDISEIETEESKDAGESTEEITGSGAAVEETEEVTDDAEGVEEPEEDAEGTEETEEVTEEAKVGAYDEKGYFDYINARRSEAGLGTFEWSDEMAEQAKEFAKGLLEDGVEPESDYITIWAKTRTPAEFDENLYQRCFDGNKDAILIEPEGKGVSEGSGAVTSYYDEEGRFSLVYLLGMKQDYSFADIDNAQYYASNSVNVRDMPSTDGSKIASLSKGEAVTVTGKCNETGWYRITDGEGGTGYVSNNYLSTEKPVTQVASNTAPAQGTPQQDASSQGGSVEYTGGDSEEDFWDWLLAQADDYTTVLGEDGALYTVRDKDVAESLAAPDWDCAKVDRSFVDYLNEQRVAAGLNPLEWMSDYEDVAMRRAVEIASNYSHDGEPSECGENITRNQQGTVDSTYTQWYNSEGHREAMFNPSFTQAVYAVYFKDGWFYAVTLFKW